MLIVIAIVKPTSFTEVLPGEKGGVTAVFAATYTAMVSPDGRVMGPVAFRKTPPEVGASALGMAVALVALVALSVFGF